MAQTFFVLGALPFVVLGGLHLLYSLLDVARPQRIVPADPAVIDAMGSSALRITKETDVWRAWLGFNLSHGLGVLFFGAAYLYLAAQHFAELRAMTPLVVAAPLMAASYLVMALKFWFRIPALGSALGLLGLLAGALLVLSRT